MKILLFGGSGQLGFEIIQRARALNFELVSPVKQEVNVSERDQVLFLVKQIKPTLIINSAAYTAVDKAESESEKAYLINHDGAANVATAAAAIGCRMIHISTDYVFDGSGSQPLDERARVNPINVYGKSKLAGELEVSRILEDKALILRTSWLHGKHGTNFVGTMIKLFQELESLKVVNDQFGSPTWVGWLAEVILDLGRTPASGIVHAANAGSTNWFEFANAIYDLVSPKLSNLKVKEILPQTSEQMERPAKRPKFSVLDCGKLRGILGREIMSWQNGVRGHLSDLGILGGQS